MTSAVMKRDEQRTAQDQLEALYKQVGIPAVFAAAAYVRRPQKQTA